MRKNKLYRRGAALLAAVMVFTCMPQSGMYAFADEQDTAAVFSEDAGEDARPELQEDNVQEIKAGLSEDVPPGQVHSTPEDSMPEGKAPEMEVADGDGTDDTGKGEETPKPVPVTAIKLNKEKITLQRKTTETLTYTFEPADADTGGEPVTFASSAESVATVDTNGTVTAIDKGVTTITATTANGKKASCTVEVTKIPVAKVTISKTRLEMVEPEPESAPGPTPEPEPDIEGRAAGAVSKETLQVNVLPEDADNLVVKVTSTAPAVADVTSIVDKGKGVYEVEVTARRGGSCSIKAEAEDDNRMVALCDVFVAHREIDVTAIAPKNTSYEVYEGNTVGLAVNFTPGNTTQRELRWEVGNGSADDKSSDYVTVNARGVVTANALPEGAAEATAYVRAFSAANAAVNTTFIIKIKKKEVPVKSIRVEPRTLDLEDAGILRTARVTVQITPGDSTDRVILAASDDEEVAVASAGSATVSSNMATVDANGTAVFTVTAKKPGECKLTFKAGRWKKGDTGDKQFEGSSLDPAECDVTVTEYVWPVKNLKLPTSLKVTELEKGELTAEVEPATAENRNIDWSVSDPEIVSIVDADGKPVERTVASISTDKDGIGHLTSTVKINGLMRGTCTVTATASGGVKRQCKVTVESGAVPAEGLTVMSTDGSEEVLELTLKPGKSYKLVPSVTPGNTTNKKVRWSSDSPTVVVLEKGGIDDGYSCTVKAECLGNCTVTAQASGTSKNCTKTVTVNVIEPHLEVEYPENWSYTPDDLPVTADKLKEKLKVWFYPVEDPDPQKDKTELTVDGYQLTVIGEDGKTELDDVAAGMEKPGDKILVVSHTYNDVKYTENISVTMKEFARANLVSVTPLSGEDAVIWNVKNATPAASLPLPKATEIIVKGESSGKETGLEAGIVWNVAGSGYNPSNEQAQSFIVYGEVQLPEYVTNPEGVSLAVEAQVHVREAATTGKAVEMPKFSVAGGGRVGNRTTVTLPYGSRIVVECETEGADIYYMLNRRPDPERGVPKDEEHRYKNPIEVTAKTTTIYAVASMSGYLDSECSECTVKLISVDPVEPDDPDDPDDPTPDDVTDADREQIGGEVPEGLWAAVQMEAGEKDGFAYTGKAVKPEVHVYDYTRRLTEKKDYTVSYRNNVNAGSAKGSAKPPTIVVTGKGNYEGKAEVYFTIKPQSIEDDAVLMDEYVAVAYTGKELKPVPSLSWNGRKLSKNRDYTYPDVSYVKAGIYEVEVSGTGNYTGTRKVNFEIYERGVAVSDFTVTKVANQKYTGSVIKPPVTVRYKNTVLVEGTEKSKNGNYWIKYENCKGPGNASIVIVGKNNYRGSRRINFKILPTAAINQAGITLNVPAAGTPYTGEEIRPECTVNYAGTVLKRDTDYKLKYQNNTKAGTATVLVTGMGAFTGSVKKTFKILPNNISQLVLQMEKAYAYEKGGCKPKPVVNYNGKTLQEGTDYTLVYRNNNKVGPSASVTVKGKGNYTGQIDMGFEVTMQDIANLKVVAADKAYQQKANIYKTKVQVIDVNGKALAAGSDYAKEMVYTYADGSKEGEPVLATDILPVGTMIKVGVQVANPKNYQGTAYGTYRIVQADISRAKVSVNPQQYTGKKVRPKKSQMQVMLNGAMLGKDDYEIVGYENNINQGNGKVTIRGIGSYGGTKTVNFKIGKKGLLGLVF